MIIGDLDLGLVLAIWDYHIGIKMEDKDWL